MIRPGEAITLDIGFSAERTVTRPVVGVSLDSSSGQTMYAIDFDLLEQGVGPLSGEGTVTVQFTDVPLLDGHYTVTARISDRVDADLVARRVSHEGFSVLNPGVAHGVVSLGVGSVALS